MRKASIVAAAFAQGSAPGQAGFAAPGEEETALAEGEGRSEAFANCTVCHNTALIRRSASPRKRWDELMNWMAEKQGVNPLEGAFRETIVNCLAQHHGPRARDGRNPFLD
jgi:mono/diheme cytochrome c family protein